MAISDRIEATINRWAAAWGDRLGLWTGRVIGKGIEGFADVVGVKFSKLLGPTIAKMEESGAVTPELRPFIDELKNPTGETAMFLADKVAGGVVGAGLSSLIDNLAAPVARAMAAWLPNQKIGAALVLQLMLRHPEDKMLYAGRLREFGFNDQEIALMFELLSPLWPSDVVAPLWLRNKTKYAKYWDDVRKLGVSDDKIEGLKELAYRIPGVQDIIRYVVKEAYSPEIYKEFGQDQEYPGLAEADAEKAGVRPDQLLKEWISHWDLPSVGNGFEMLHRGEITQDQLAKLLKARDIMPFWRDKLTAISWSLPGRVELRMMTQYGIADKALCVKILEADGLAEEYREDVADMMVVRGARTDIQTRYTKGWLDSAGVQSEIAALNLSQTMADRMYQWIVTNAKGDRTSGEKDLTMAQIVAGVKKGIIDQETGIEDLMVMGYDEEEARYIMAINIEVIPTEVTDALSVQVDSIRRQRRQRLISRDEEISELIALGLDTELATAYAGNDDLRLVKEAAPKPPGVVSEYQTADGKVKIETIRLARRQGLISRLEEVTSLADLEMPAELASSYADNDDLRLVAPKPVPVIVAVPYYQTPAGKVEVETIRLKTRQRLLTEELTTTQIAAGVVPKLLTGEDARQMEIRLLTRLEMDGELATAYADNDELRLVKQTTGGA